MSELEKHNAEQISRLYDVMISLTERVDALEAELKHLKEHMLPDVN